MIRKLTPSRGRGPVAWWILGKRGEIGPADQVSQSGKPFRKVGGPAAGLSERTEWPVSVVLALTTWVVACLPSETLARGGKEAAFEAASVQNAATDPQTQRDDQQSLPPRAIRLVEPIYPLGLRMEGVEGHAVVYFLISVEGRAFDFVTFAASDPAFAKATIRAAKRSRFAPALVRGRPSVSRFQSRQIFKIDPSNPLGGGNFASPRASASKDTGYRVSELRELDTPPQALEVVAAEYPEAMIENDASGQVLVEFFIDPEGGVHAPKILSSSNGRFAMAAFESIRQWVFEPPLRKGRPVWARVYQPFFFNHPIVELESSMASRD